MTAKRSILIVAAIIFAGVIFFTVFNKLDGFQNATAPDGGADIKTQICEIFRGTYNSLSTTVDKMENSNIKVSDATRAHLDSIKAQMEQHGC